MKDFKFPTALTTVTPFSKLLALFLLCILPLTGFYLGVNYQKSTQARGNLNYPFKGIVTSIDISQTAVDGDGYVTLQTEQGKYTIAIPSGEQACAADTTDFHHLQIGDKVEVYGNFQNGQATICESPQHYLRLLNPSTDSSSSSDPIITGHQLATPTMPITTSTQATECHTAGGTWLAEYSECEYVSETWCQQSGGIFHECESNCRHDPAYPNVYCVQVCVPVCIVKN